MNTSAYPINTSQWRTATAMVGLLLFAFITPATAHDVVIDLENISPTAAAGVYLELGFTHILPLGLDHILFVLSLYLLNPSLKPILWQATAFTLAHSVTLALSMYQVLIVPPAIVEPAIALSILFVALQNIYGRKLQKSRLAIVFLFGLLHGMGFAGVLSEIGLPDNSFFSSLLFFNIGVEIGQVAVILLAYLLVGRWFGKKPYYRNRILIPASVMFALLAAYWTIERIV